MDTENRQALGNRQLRLRRIGGVIALVAAGVLIAANIPLTLVADHQRTDLFETFEKDSGFSIDNLASDSEDRLYIWWEEWRIPDADYDKMQAYIDSGKNGGKFGTKDISGPEAFSAFLAAQNLDETGSNSGFWKHLSADLERSPGQPSSWALIGYLPPKLRDEVPPTGRLNNPNASAEYRLLVDWEGHPIPAKLLSQAALPLKAHYKEFFSIGYEADIEGAKDLHSIKDRVDSVSFLDFHEVMRNILGQIESGRIPVPQSIDEKEHNRLRLANPGSRLFLDSVLLPYGAYYWTLEKYARQSNASISDIYQRLVKQRDIRAKQGGRFDLKHIFVDGNEASWILWVLAVGCVIGFMLEPDWLPNALRHFDDSGVGPVPPSTGTSTNRAEPESGSAGPGTSRTNDARFDGRAAKSSAGLPTVEPQVASSTRGTTPAMTPIDPRTLQETLAGKNAFGRGMHHWKQMDIGQKTKEQIESETAVISAQGEQYVTIRRLELELFSLQNQIAEHQTEGEVGDLKRQKRVAELQAEIARLNDEPEKVRYDQEKRKRELEPIPQPIEKAPLSDKDKARKRWFARRAGDMALSDVRDEEAAKIREQFKDDPNSRQIYLDFLQDWYEEELQK